MNLADVKCLRSFLGNTNGSQKKTSSPPQLTLNEILEDCDASVTDPSLESTSGHVVKSQVVIRRTG